MRRPAFTTRASLLLAATLASWSATTAPARAEQGFPEWFGVGVGPVSLLSHSPAPSAGRRGVAVSLDVGAQVSPQWGLGLEYGAALPASGCSQVDCGTTAREFAPDFEHLFVVGEFRPDNTHWRLRLAAGVMRYCYRARSNWGLDLLGDMLDAFGDGHSEGEHGYCDDLNAFGASASVGYDWPLVKDRPFAVGLRLGVETAGFRARGAEGLPAFRHRAAMLTLQLSFM